MSRVDVVHLLLIYCHCLESAQIATSSLNPEENGREIITEYHGTIERVVPPNCADALEIL